MIWQLENEGIAGVESVGFSPDKSPELIRGDVVGFVVFETFELMQAAEGEQRACWAWLGTELQLLNKPMKCGVKDPKKIVALDRREARHTGAAKRQRGVETAVNELPKPLDKGAGAGCSTRAGDNTGQRGGGVSRPVIAVESGMPMTRGGEEAIREMDKLANDQLVEQLGRQMKELISGLAQK